MASFTVNVKKLYFILSAQPGCRQSASFRKSKTSATRPLSESEGGVPDHDGYGYLQTIEKSLGQPAACGPEKRRADPPMRRLPTSQRSYEARQSPQSTISRLDTYGITINLSKCAFEKDKIDFLGYEVLTSGISPLEEKIKAIVAYPRPKTIVELRRFLGMLNFSRAHLPKAAEHQEIFNKHIHGAKKKDKTPIDWTPDDERAFEKCKVSLQSAVILSHPLADTILGLMTDASNTAVGTDSETPRRKRQLLFISEFTTDIRHFSGEGNAVADALSRVDAITCSTTINFEELSAAQSDDATLTHLLQDTDSSAKLNYFYLPVKLPLTSRKLMSERYFWPNMNRDVGNWAKSCIQYQRAKVQRHVISDLGRFSPSERFGHIHVDIVGPLPTTTDDYKYLLTIIDRCTGWPEAFPMKDISADSVAKVILKGWIARYGCPSKLTSDQGKQFESNLFHKLSKFLGIDKIRTTPYHPQSNGMVERWYRSLKSALRAPLNHKSWIEELPIILLGLRAVPQSDTNVSAAELTFGKTLRLPGNFYDTERNVNYDSYEYVQKLRQSIDRLKPRPAARNYKHIFVYADLKTCNKVFVRNDTVRKQNSLIDRLKPAYVLNETDVTDGTSPQKVHFTPPELPSPTSCHETPKISRSGRIIRRPEVMTDRQPIAKALASTYICDTAPVAILPAGVSRVASSSGTSRRQTLVKGRQPANPHH
ncbi:Retrovirus-related Pol polyprotein from transposon 412 [Eumeta japonica]|uniref:RNA-directed DNA polymerase n=1 Tax=Eumeta variegata TaxID=151549 RepID=A0A4C1UVE8_EUMVA|nr:Retrovirus-related Pol polyprotein from transposon 412 [Eumeta japonica]